MRKKLKKKGDPQEEEAQEKGRPISADKEEGKEKKKVRKTASKRGRSKERCELSEEREEKEIKFRGDRKLNRPDLSARRAMSCK